MTYLIEAWVLLGLLLLGVSNQNKYRVFYIPMEISEYFVPVTIHSIERRAYFIFDDSSKSFDALFESINPNNISRDSVVNPYQDILEKYGDIRIKIISINTGKVIYVDTFRKVYSDWECYAVGDKILQDVLADIKKIIKGKKKRKVPLY